MNDSDKKLWTFHQTDNAENLTLGHPRQDMLLKKVSAYIKDGNILEIGFGDGYLLEKLSKKHRCYGADISTENIDQMKKKISSVTFNEISVDGLLPYQDSFFDVFIASEVLEHMSDEELQISVSEIKRVLKSGGVAIITVPAEENLKNNECFCPNCGEVFHKWGHKQFWNKEKISTVFDGLELMKITEYFNRYEGKGLFEFFVGYILYFIRNAINIFKKLENRTYIIILKK